MCQTASTFLAEALPVSEETAFSRLVTVVRDSGLPHVLHSHKPTRTVAEAGSNLTFDVNRIVKTIAFGLRTGETILAALRGTRRVAYPALAAICGVSRRELLSLSPQEVLTRLGVAPGGVSPVPLGNADRILLDADVLTIVPTLYCGLGRPDRTLEIAPADLLTLLKGSGGSLGDFSK